MGLGSPESEVERLGARGLPYAALHQELADRIRRVFPVDAACWHGLDPDTRLLTTANPVELMTAGFLTLDTEALAAGAVVTSEYLREDVNTFASLATRRTPVGILSETTRGRPERSARYVEYLQPIGTPFEMRAAMVTRGRAWGCVVLHRTEATGDFTPEDARVMARLSRPIAEALRHSYRFDAARRADEDRAPGLLVLDANDEVEFTTPPTRALLESLAIDDPLHRSVPIPALTLAAEVRRQGRAGRSAAPLHVPTSSGWLTFHGSLPDGSVEGRVAIVVQRAGEEYAVPLRLEAFGLTARERRSPPSCLGDSIPPRSPSDWSSPPGPCRTTSRRSSPRPTPTRGVNCSPRSSSTTSSPNRRARPVKRRAPSADVRFDQMTSTSRALSASRWSCMALMASSDCRGTSCR